MNTNIFINAIEVHSTLVKPFSFQYARPYTKDPILCIYIIFQIP